MIVASARPEDLPALRLTCKQLHGNSTKHFAAAFTTDVKLMISRKSLRSIIDISKHPVYRPLVRSITIDTVGLDGNGMELLSPGHNLRKCIRRAQHQVSLKASGTATAMFTKALENFKISGDTISLGMGDHLPGLIGHKSFWGSLPEYEEDMLWFCDRDFVLELLLDAAQKSQCNVNRFKLHTNHEGTSYEVCDEPHEVGTITLPSHNRETLAAACRLFKILELGVNPAIMFEAAVTVESISRLISLSPGVKDLTLRLGMDCFDWECFFDVSISRGGDVLPTPGPQHVFHELGTATASMKLERLCLLHVIGHYTNYEKLFQEHCNTLHALELTGCILWGTECWKAESWSCLLNFLLENMHLTELKVKLLSVAGTCELEEDDWETCWSGNELYPVSSKSVSLFGEEEVRAWLNQEVDRLADIERCRCEDKIRCQLEWEAELRAAECESMMDSEPCSCSDCD